LRELRVAEELLRRDGRCRLGDGSWPASGPGRVDNEYKIAVVWRAVIVDDDQAEAAAAFSPDGDLYLGDAGWQVGNPFPSLGWS
jgi:hypothetical protein